MTTWPKKAFTYTWRCAALAQTVLLVLFSPSLINEWKYDTTQLGFRFTTCIFNVFLSIALSDICKTRRCYKQTKKYGCACKGYPILLTWISSTVTQSMFCWKYSTLFPQTITVLDWCVYLSFAVTSFMILLFCCMCCPMEWLVPETQTNKNDGDSTDDDNAISSRSGPIATAIADSVAIAIKSSPLLTAQYPYPSNSFEDVDIYGPRSPFPESYNDTQSNTYLD